MGEPVKRGAREAYGSQHLILSYRRFFRDAAEGRLPPVSIVDPDFRSSSGENPQDVDVGEGFSAAVIDAVTKGKGWAEHLAHLDVRRAR